MSPEGSEKPAVFVDACCWIDLFATGHVEEILGMLPCRFFVSQYVLERELISIRGEAGDEQPGDLRGLLRKGLLVEMPLQSREELRSLVTFAAHLDDGEASICALAQVHRGAVATNDRKAINTLRRLAPEIPVLQTPELLFRWAEGRRRSPEELRTALERVRDRARFLPRRDAPYAEWWFEILNAGVQDRP